MGWFDKLLYNLGQASPIGRAIEGAKQDDRLAALAGQYTSAPDLATFAAIPAADNIYKPEHIVALEKLKEARKGVLQQQAAAPIAKMLSQWQAEGNDADPNFTGAEWIKGMATTDAGMKPEDYDALKAGSIPGAKKGSLPLSTFEANPVTAKLLQDAELAAQQKSGMARAFDNRATPMDLATLAMNKEGAAGFDNTTQGTKRVYDVRSDADKTARGNLKEDNLAQFLSAIAGLSGPSTSPNDLAQFKGRGGYAPYPQVESDILQAARDYPVSGEVVNQAVDNARQTYKDTMLPPETVKVGRTTATGQRNLMGDFKKDAQSTAPVINVNTRNAQADARQRAKDFQNDLNYKRKIEGLIASGGSGEIALADGTKMSFGGGKDVALLKTMLADQDTTMRALYPEEMAKRNPKQPRLPEGNGRQVPVDKKGQPIAGKAVEQKSLDGVNYWKDEHGIWRKGKP